LGGGGSGRKGRRRQGEGTEETRLLILLAQIPASAYRNSYAPSG
jgi:hypothetical protein